MAVTLPDASWLRRICLIIASLEWLFLALVLPAILLIAPAWTPILLVLPLLWGIRRMATGHFVPPTPLDWPLFVMLVMVLVSLYITFDLAFSLPKVAGLIYGVAIYYAVVTAISLSKQRLWVAVTMFLSMGVGVAIVGYLFMPTAAKLPILRPILQSLPIQAGSQPGFVTINPNEVAGVLLWLAPLSFAMALSLLVDPAYNISQRWGRTMLIRLGTLLAAVFIISALILTQSRSGLLGLVTGISIIGLMLLKRHRRALLSLVALSVAVLLLVVGLIQTQERWRLLLYQVTGAPNSNLGTVGFTSRPDIWQRAIYGIEDFPFTGMGMGTFREAVPVLYPIFSFSNKDVAHAHNHLLQAALDLGIPGLVAYLALWFGAGIMLWTVWGRGSTRYSRMLAVGLAGCLLAYFVYGLTDTVALGARPGFLFWYLLGLITALYKLEESGVGERNIRPTS